MAELSIYGAPQSNFVWAVRIAAAEKGVPHRLVQAMPGSREITDIHPFGRMPVMRHGAVALAESRAIVRYIDRGFDGPPLERAGLVEGSRDEMWASLAITAIDQVLIRQYTFAFFFPATADGSPDLAAAEACWPRVETALRAIDRGIAEGDILAREFRLADAWIVPMLYYQRMLPGWDAMVALAPRLPEALDRALSRASVAETTPPPLPAREPA